MNQWPNTIPEDLRERLAGVMGFRDFGPAEIYGELKDWLEKHGVEPPGNLPERAEIRPDMDQ